LASAAAALAITAGDAFGLAAAAAAVVAAFSAAAIWAAVGAFPAIISYLCVAFHAVWFVLVVAALLAQPRGLLLQHNPHVSVIEQYRPRC
jgi:hypothetical protein